MTRDEFKRILTPLVLAMRAEFDAPTWLAYYRVLGEVPDGLLETTVARMMRAPREFFPKAGELLAACETHRRAFLAAHPYEGCIDCEHSRGWIELEGRAHRCPCWTRHRAQLETWGVGQALAELPGEEQAQSEQQYPTLEQLPAPLRQQLERVAGQKVLR